jgi:hypothetical protein
MSDKLEFASEAWFEALKALLPKYAAGAGPDLELSLCEVFTGVPAHLDAHGNGVIAWHCRIKGGQIDFLRTEADDCDYKTVIDYEAVLPMARFVVTPETRAAYDALGAAAAASGKVKRSGDPSRIPPSFYGMHNDLAVRTL